MPSTNIPNSPNAPKGPKVTKYEISDVNLLMQNDGQTLESFLDYCEKNPAERFWQALRNWSGQDFVFFGNVSNRRKAPDQKPVKFDDQNVYLDDTYSFLGRTE